MFPLHLRLWVSLKTFLLQQRREFVVVQDPGWMEGVEKLKAGKTDNGSDANWTINKWSLLCPRKAQCCLQTLSGNGCNSCLCHLPALWPSESCITPSPFLLLVCLDGSLELYGLYVYSWKKQPCTWSVKRPQGLNSQWGSHFPLHAILPFAWRVHANLFVPYF